MKFLVWIIALFTVQVCFGQFVYEVDTSTPLTVDGESLNMPWAGGINSAQYNSVDLNNDGTMDLLVFDRTGQRIVPFISDGSKYTYSPEYAYYFPEEVKNWVLMRDFNCDGKQDLFTSHTFGARVYLNVSEANGPIQWEPYITGFDNSGNEQVFIKTQGFTSLINLQINSSDIPNISDYDEDGDLDIMIFSASGGSTVEYHKNMSMERNGTCDSLLFERVTNNWGQFKECECGKFAFNGESCDSGGRLDHEGGKALLVADVDGDGDNDALVSEETCPVLYFLENVGSNDSPIFNTAEGSFPNSTNPAILLFYPAPFLEDVTFDGNADLLVSPAVGYSSFGSVNFENSSWLYVNGETNSSPNFSFEKRNFLQGEMFDIGENAYPSFADIDGDGDYDMLVGSYLDLSKSGFTSSLRLFINDGTPALPSFQADDTDYLGLSMLGLFNLKPSFTDINNDGYPDLIFSGTDPRNLNTAIYYILNKGGRSFEFDDQIQLLLDGLGTEDNYRLYDIDGDGLQDLLIGRRSGKIEYYRNTGNDVQVIYTLEDDSFYGIDFSTSSFDKSLDIADLDADGEADMIVGDKAGNFAIYNSFLKHLDDPQPALSDIIMMEGENMVKARLGSRLFPVVANLFNEDKPAIMVGSGQGGIQILRNAGGITGGSSSFDVNVYPNPINKNYEPMLQVKSKFSGTATIVNLLGQKVTNDFILRAGEVHEINIDLMNSGMYIIILSADGEDYVSRSFIVME